MLSDGQCGLEVRADQPDLYCICVEKDCDASFQNSAVASSVAVANEQYGSENSLLPSPPEGKLAGVDRSPSVSTHWPESIASNDSSGLGSLESITNSMIMASVRTLAAELQPWQREKFRQEGVLQAAPCNFGHVLLMETNDNSKIAVKKIPNSWMTSGHIEFSETYPTASENPWNDIGICRILSEKKFKHSCQYMGIYRDVEHTFVASELGTEGDLHTWCNRLNVLPGPDRERYVAPLMVEMFSAVRLLHEMGIAHRDISCENILITTGADGARSLKIIDFGMATAHQFTSQACVGKTAYRAPEIHQCVKYDSFMVDAFAVGVVLFIVTFSDYPWKSTAKGSCTLFDFIQDRGISSYFAHRRTRFTQRRLIEVCSFALFEILAGLMELSPDKRLCLGETCYLGSRSASVWTQAWTLAIGSRTADDEIRVVV